MRDTQKAWARTKMQIWPRTRTGTLAPRFPLWRAVLLSFTVLAMLTSLACIKAAVHPGAVNSTDSTLYDALLSVQTSLETLKTQIGPMPSPTLKASLNTALAAYNTAMASYKTYHGILVSGGTPDVATLQAQVAAVIADVTTLTAQVKGVAGK